MGQAAPTALEAVADPIRLRIVRHLAVGGTASVAELARAAGVHANTIRAHVAELERHGILHRAPSVPRGPGRPALQFRLHDDAPPPDTDPHGLAKVLASLAGRPRGTRALARLRSAGAAWGRGRAGSGHELIQGLAQLGFRARIDGDRLELSACPCPLVAPAHPETVCQLAHGAVNGILAGSGRRVLAADHHPERRRCTLDLGS
jgi:predicted ArsR family transcriptional regulator